jgi:hypothetical protein
LKKEFLTDKFFKENTVKELTAQFFVYTQIQEPLLTEFASDYVRKYEDRADEEKETLLRENNPDILLKMLRGKCDVINQPLLHQKVLEHEETLAPRMFEMYVKSLNTVFIENSAKILARTQNDYSEELLKILDEIRSPYAMSLACITLGFIADKLAVPMLLNKFYYFKKFYPEENYEQGALLGLMELDNRFHLIRK